MRSGPIVAILLTTASCAPKPAPSRVAPAPYDLVIRNGDVVDGTGSPARRADVAIAGDRIVAVGRVSGAAVRTIDAAALAATQLARWSRRRATPQSLAARIALTSPSMFEI